MMESELSPLLKQCFLEYDRSIKSSSPRDLYERILALDSIWPEMGFGKDWLDVLYQPIFELAKSPWWRQLRRQLLKEEQPVYPRIGNIFGFAVYCPPEKVKVVIVGQDPYPNEKAHGLAFSVLSGEIPPSLKNIFKLLEKTVPDFEADSGNLTPWAEQGVLLLNSVLTYPPGCQGCEDFTDAVIRYIDENNEYVVFMLWGKKAQAKSKFIKNPTHLVLETSHPGNQSAHLGFLKCGQFDDDSCDGCDHFNRCNAFLAKYNKPVIEWSL